ncbi:uncharacterized protein TM35_000192570 [Trypanosoma theileri]|uniref:Uncharacterized protein n=1 Tax=Trypanosoma theileri TaxID=67003 RepID=A0A1X0NU50_9TRYP|nr:uncharacterized protein TM35_000192570 [Trypanosoma theileri]ORC88013.1 hypothetical protein TM35_000192570 [Trypanosoma theileri]
MFLRNRGLHSYQRGGWCPGSKHQKHMSMNPTLYLYRFPGPHGPGPYTMKYWWTLGCFPTGREVPFRLQEFLSTYKQEHVPIEVEEWLHYFVKNPASELINASTELFDALEASPEIEATRGYKAIQPSVVPLLEPIKKFEKQLGVKISPVGVRAVISSPSLKERFLDDLYEYRELIRTEGSTPHRRLAKKNFDDALPISEEEKLHIEGGEFDSIGKELGNFVGDIVSPPECTAADEKKLIQLFTTVSEGCISSGHYDEATSMLAGALMFCHDADTEAVAHANLAVGFLLNGEFKEAEFNGREAALLQPKPKLNSSGGARGYAAWATAVAYQDDFEKAESIVQDALRIHEDDELLKQLSAQIRELRTTQKLLSSNGEVPYSLRGSKIHMPSQRSRALATGNGKGFDNEFDWIVFNNKLYPSKMNPTTNEMGSVFRRVGNLGLFISTSMSMERI